MNQRLYTRSIQIIRENQTECGSYIASPAFPTYHFSWLRDGSYIAYAMDLAGEHESARAFYRWLGATIDRYAGKVNVIETTLMKGLKLHPDQALHTRFTFDGLEDALNKGWGNFQIDGYGTWLWGLSEHVRQTGGYSLLQELGASIRTTLRFLQLTWKLPNYDCWEEFPEFMHTYSLSCVYGGLHSIQQLINEGKFTQAGVDVAGLAEEVRSFILRYGIVNGVAVKSIQPPEEGSPAKAIIESGLDASLMGLDFPNQALKKGDPILEATFAGIEEQLLRREGGVYRYLGDVYYGGGEWLLLTAWLGLHFVESGQKEKALTLMNWIEAQADEDLNLPEQVNDNLLFPEQYQPWLKKWGPVAKPLLWSHAMYIILYKKLQENN
jgi:GH15 family glucan-1,4-alpha-glucosidase